MKFYNSSKKTFLNIRCDLLVCLLIILSILFIYQQVRHHDFINLDDDVYVTANDQVRSGLNKKSIKWSFGIDDKQHTYWHPLTWLSHMLEVELYGVEPGRHHLTNVLFHIANSLLLLFVLYRFSGALWQSAFIALVFAVHPINVESVAWVAQRKNVLSTFLWLLSLLSYGYYAAHPTIARYFLVFFAFALGLLAKPMLITLPFVLLLLDYWPLKRLYFTQLDDGDKISAGQRPHPIFFKAGLFQLIIEKIPLFIISFLSVFLSSMSVKSLSSVISLESVPLKLRIANGLVSYISYMQKLFWPKNLAIFYPYPEAIPTWNVVCASLGLIGITIAIVWLFKRQPYLGVGWLWYLGTLVPVSGLMQVGLWPAMADRWAYVPFIGLFIMISWGVPHLIRKGRYYQIGLFLAAAVVLVFLMATARVQVGYWRDSITLFEHEIKVTGSTWIAHQNLAAALYKRGRVADANIHFQIAENGPPSSPEGEYYQLALTLTTMGELDKAVKCYREALRINPKFVPAYINLGIALAQQGKPAEAINYYSTALGLDPYSEQAYFNLGNAQMAQGNVDEAIKSFNATLRIKPDFAKAYEVLGLVLLRKGEMGDAVGQFQLAVKLNPKNMQTQRNLNLALSLNREVNQAVDRMLEAMRFGLEDPHLDTRLEELSLRKKDLDIILNRYQKTLSNQPGFNGLDYDNIEPVYLLKKKYEKKLPIFKALVNELPDNAQASYHIACIYSRRGQILNAIAWLKRAVLNGFNDWPHMIIDSDLIKIKNSSNYKNFISKYRQ